jgi:hypothetical protein
LALLKMRVELGILSSQKNVVYFAACAQHGLKAAVVGR